MRVRKSGRVSESSIITSFGYFLCGLPALTSIFKLLAIQSISNLFLK